MNILSQGSWWVLNKKLTQKIGLDASYLLSDLVQRYEYFKERDKLQDDGSFFCKQDILEKETTLTQYRQTSAIKILVELGMVELIKKGAPSFNFYKLNINVINKFVFDLYDEHI